jgi:hypothetical protein
METLSPDPSPTQWERGVFRVETTHCKFTASRPLRGPWPEAAEAGAL